MLHFPTETVDKHITRIYAFATELMYLIEGDRQNILIDTGSGFGSLKAATDQILASHNNTKPLQVLLTHGHVDHACGAREFVSAGIPVYMSPADRYIYLQHTEEDFRLDGFSMEDFDGHGSYVKEEDYMQTAPADTLKPLHDGDVFDLGGVTVQAIACPGHTLGSMIFLIRESEGDTYLLTGDACNTFTFLFQSYSTSIEEYEEHLQEVAQKLHGQYDHVLLSHGDGIGYVGLLEDVCQVCEQIKSGKTDSVPFRFNGSDGVIALNLAPGTRKGNIVFHPDRIWKKGTEIC